VILEVQDMHTYYGSSHVLQGVSLTVRSGEVVTLLGRNGAGKTTTLRSIVALTRARRGRILLDGQDVTKGPSHKTARKGMAFVPSGRRVFGTLTVAQNLKLAARSCGGRTGAWTIEKVTAMFPKLDELSGRRAEHLSGGEQQMLKLGRALLTNPQLLLLDEPTEGLSPAVVGELGNWLDKIREEDLGVLLTEQNSVFALRHADRGYILEKGRCQAEGSAHELAEGDALPTYLGIGANRAGAWSLPVQR
jgi:branched-chain amino acid transport system ATP-binding protein